MPKHTVTMQDVANACHLSKMTVSLALKNDVRVKKETKKLVLQKAAELGYKSNPYVSVLMAQLRTSSKRKASPVIAFLNLKNPPEDLHANNAGKNYYMGAKARAESLGFRLEEFSPFAKGMTLERLEKIFYTRNLHALLLTPADHRHTHIDLHWERYAAAKFGFTVDRPDVHSVTTDHFQSVQLLTNELFSLGYRHMGLALPDSMNDRVDHRWAGAFLYCQWNYAKKAKLELFVPTKWDKASFLKWFKSKRPQVVISYDPIVPTWLEEAGYAIPEDVGYATVDWSRDYPHFSGINPHPQRVGRLGIDLVIEQVHRNEYGIPPEAKRVLVAGEWVMGSTVKKQRHD